MLDICSLMIRSLGCLLFMLLTGGVEPFWKPGRPAVTTQRKARFAFVSFVVDLFGVIYCLRNIFDRRLILNLKTFFRIYCLRNIFDRRFILNLKTFFRRGEFSWPVSAKDHLSEDACDLVRTSKRFL